MKTKRKTVELFLQSGSDYTIVDHKRNPVTLEEAKVLWDCGLVENFNLAFKRLVDNGFDLQKTKDQLRGK